jgi:hypothetical protein
MDLDGGLMGDVFYKTRWRLVYLDGRYLDEALSGSTIMDRVANPVELQLINLQGVPVRRIDIPVGHKPVFYRQRSISQTSSGAFGETQLDATVFGYGRENGSSVDGKLWLWRGGQAVNCPPEYIAERSIEIQLAVRD